MSLALAMPPDAMISALPGDQLAEGREIGTFQGAGRGRSR